MTYQFDADIAARFGVDEAVMIFNLSFWIRKNEANGRHFHDGRYWTYNSIEAFTKLFPFWTARQIRRVLKSLEEHGVIVTGNYNTMAYDRTTWYAFGDSFLRNGQIHFTESSNGKDDLRASTIIADKNTDDNTNITADGGLFPAEHQESKLRGTTEPAACLFINSRFADYDDFAAQFTAQDYAGIDICYYYNAVKDWSAQKGKKMKDWIATARNFMRGDMEKNKLHRLSGGPIQLDPDAQRYLQDMA